MAEENSSLDDKEYQLAKIKNNGKTPEIDEKQKKEFEKTRTKLEALKRHLLTKYKSIEAIGIIPPQAAEKFDEENELSEEEKKEKPIHLAIILPDDEEKQYNKIKSEILKKIKDDKLKVWLNLFLEKDLWEICNDSKFDIAEAIGMAFPMHDKGILGALRVAQIHKSLCLRKFERYVYSYVVGGSLVRGEVVKTSDVDVFVIIDDTDVKRMPRLELKEKLRNIIYSYVMEAGELAGVKNKLSPQIYLLTEFWEGVKDANPIFFTFIRDGIPLYDRGGFLPWKLLLKMGKIKPSAEAIDMFMSMGDRTREIVERKLLDIVMGDIYWGVITPSQALLMLYGLPPPTPKETVREIHKVFVEKEKMLEKKYADILETIVIKYYKAYEHEKIKTVSGAEVDKLLKDSEDYLKRLKELREQIEKTINEKQIIEIHENVFKILKSIFGEKSEVSLVKEFEAELVNKGKSNPKYLHTLNDLISAKKKLKTKKALTKHEFEHIRTNSVYLIEDLIEYSQRKDLGLLEKTKVSISFEGGHAELFLTKPMFLLHKDKVQKITDKIEDSSMEEFNKFLSEYKGKPAKIDEKLFSILRKEFGDFEITL